MSYLAIAAFICFCIYLVSRFGKQIHARNATSWWLVIAFLFVGVAYPKAYLHLAEMLGIQLVSNFVIGAMLLFLLKSALENAAESTRNARKLRELVCNEASGKYVNRAGCPHPPEGRVSALITFPTYNEEENIESLRHDFDRYLAKADPRYAIQVMFVNDASTDATELMLEQLWPGQYVTHLSNAGVSGALLTGFKTAMRLGYKYVVQCDADGQHPIEQIPSLIEVAERTGADITIGSRFVAADADHNKLESTTFIRRLGGLTISLTLRLFFPAGQNTPVSDPTSGFRVYSRAAMKTLIASMPDDYPEPESIAICTQNRLRIVETPVRMRERQGGESSISGLKSLEFMIKVFTSLLSLRVRHLLFLRK
jgi:hypothetical protein